MLQIYQLGKIKFQYDEYTVIAVARIADFLV